MPYFKRNQLSFKKTLRLKLLIVVSLLAVIPVAILGFISYAVADYGIQKEIGKTNRQTIIQIQKRIDEKLIDLNKTATLFAASPTMNNYIQSHYLKDNYLKFGEVDKVLMLLLMHDDVDTLFMYFFDDKGVYSKGFGGMGFIDDISDLDPVIKENLKVVSKRSFWIDRQTADNVHKITLFKPIPVLQSTPTGYLVLDINDSIFFKVFREVQFGSSGELVILTPSGNIIHDPSKRLLKEEHKFYPFIKELLETEEDEKIFIEKVDGQKMMISYIKSPNNGWKYATIVPVKEFNYRFDLIKNTTIIICIILMVISFITALILSGKIYGVVQSILDVIKKKNEMTPHPNEKADEMGIIRNYVEFLQSLNTSLENEVKNAKPLLQADFLQRLLTESLCKSEIDEKFDYYGIKRVSSYFTVMCIEIDNLREQTEKDTNLFLFAIVNISQEIVANHSHGLVVKTHTNHIAIILNHDPLDVNRQNNAFHIAEEIRDIAQNLLKITVTIGVGRCYEGVEQIRVSYREAMEALQYQLVEGNGTVIFIGQVNPEVCEFVYPIKIEQLIILNMKLGNFTQVCALIDDFSTVIKKQEQKNHEYVRQAFFQLVASSIRAFYELDPDNTPGFLTHNLYYELNKFKTMDQIVSWLKEKIYPAIIEHILKCRRQKDQQSIDKVVEYIHLHYYEDLSQPAMAELISMPPSQFSQLFREKIGMTFTDYVITFRMEKAKEMLVSSDMKISDIAERLRYNNSQNFIRTFKQFTGITPGEYRAAYQNTLPDAKTYTT